MGKKPSDDRSINLLVGLVFVLSYFLVMHIIYLCITFYTITVGSDNLRAFDKIVKFFTLPYNALF